MSFCLEILCYMVVTNIFFQYPSQTTRQSLENIERLVIFYKFILRRYQIMLIVIVISIMKFYTSASLVLKCLLYRDA